MANRIYEKMRDIIAPKHIASPEAFYEFRQAQIENAWNMVESAGGDLAGRKTRLVQGDEKQLAKLEAMEASADKTPIDMSKPPTLPRLTMPSDQFSGIGDKVRQRHGLKQE